MAHSSGASRLALVHRAAQPGEGGAALPAASSAWAQPARVCAGAAPLWTWLLAGHDQAPFARMRQGDQDAKLAGTNLH